MSFFNEGPGLFTSFNNINPPGDLTTFQPYLDAGLSRVNVFTFVPNNSLPTNGDWFTTNAGGQPQGLDTWGTGTPNAWADLFEQFTQEHVQIGFTFGGAGATANLGSMMAGLNNSSTDFENFVKTLQFYHVSFIHFDIESTWETPPGFSDQFQAFAENLLQTAGGTIAIEIGASAPIGTVNGASSEAPSFLTSAFVSKHHIYFNVYTYYELEVDNVIAENTPWIPSKTDISPDRILFSVSCNATTPAPEGQLVFKDFMKSFLASDLKAAVEQQGYLGFTTWVWWQHTETYPSKNCLLLFGASAI